MNPSKVDAIKYAISASGARPSDQTCIIDYNALCGAQQPSYYLKRCVSRNIHFQLSPQPKDGSKEGRSLV